MISMFAFVMIFVVTGLVTGLALWVDFWTAILSMLIGALWMGLAASTSEWLRSQFAIWDDWFPDERVGELAAKRIEQGRIKLEGLVK